MHIQTDEKSVTLTPFGSLAQNVGNAAHRSEENQRRIFDPADIILFAFVIIVMSVLIAFVF